MDTRRAPECFMYPSLMSSVRHPHFRRLRRMTGESYGTLLMTSLMGSFNLTRPFSIWWIASSLFAMETTDELHG